MTQQERALLARQLNSLGRHAIRATSETLHLFSEAEIEEARRIAIRRIDVRKPRGKKK